jgi:hypothetical protein
VKIQSLRNFSFPTLATASLCFILAMGSSVQAQFSNTNRIVSSRSDFRQNVSVPGELLRLPSSARIDDSFQELDTGKAGTYTFINAPSRFRYRFSGRYNGYANRPRPFLYRSYTQQLNVGDARRLCRTESMRNLPGLKGELLELGSQDDRRHNLLVGCSQRYQLVGSPSFIQAETFSFVSSDEFNFTTATMLPIDEGEFENFELPWDGDFDVYY